MIRFTLPDPPSHLPPNFISFHIYLFNPLSLKNVLCLRFQIRAWDTIEAFPEGTRP